MLYCTKCMHLLENGTEKCQFCKGKKFREPEANDSVWLTTQNFIFAGIIEELFADHGIPCMKIGRKGEGMSITIGYVAEIYDFYVPFSAYEAALELLEQVLTDGEIVADEFDEE